jgi:hypothetical protein
MRSDFVYNLDPLMGPKTMSHLCYETLGINEIWLEEEG